MTHRNRSSVSRTLFLLPLLALGSCQGRNAPSGFIGEAPNVLPVSVSFSPAQIVTGETITVSETIKNIGSRPAGAFEVGVYLSVDATIETTDLLLGVRSVSELPVGGFSNTTGDLTANVAPGTYFIGVIADHDLRLPERVREDNVLAAGGKLAVMPSTVDLVVSALGHDLCKVRRGMQVEVSNTVRNIGGHAAGAFRVGIYASKDPVITTADPLLARRVVDELLPGQDSAAVTVIVADLVPGDWYIGAVADIDDTLLEVDELNNEATSASCGGKLAVDPPVDPAELALRAVVHAGCAVEQGQGIRLDATVENSGVGAAGPFRVSFYASEDPVITRGDVLLAARDVAGLAPSATSDVGSAAVIDLSPGTWFIGAIADSGNDVVEGDETNNATPSASCDGKIAVTPKRGQPDLEMVRLSQSLCTVERGKELVIAETVANNGDAAAMGFRVAVYASTDDLVTRDDVLLGVRTVGELPPNATSASDSRVTINLAPGEWFIGAIADELDSVAESNERNNTLLSQSCGGKIVVTRASEFANLAVRKLGHSACSVERGARVSFTYEIVNDDRRHAGPFRAGIYASKDEDITAADTLIGSRNVGALAGFSSQEFTDSHRIDLAPGTWFIGAIADDRKMVDESNEGDNTAVSVACGGKLDVTSPRGPADLAVRAFTIGQCSVVQGARADFGLEVRNDGGTAAGAFRIGIFAGTSPDLPSSSRLLAVVELPGLEPGERFKKSLSVVLNLPVGEFWIGAIADYPNEVRDADRGNNRLLSQSCGGKVVITSPPGRPDLSLRLFRHIPCAVREGKKIRLLDLIRNEGSVASGPFLVRVFASKDKDIDPEEDELIAYRRVKELAPGRYTAALEKARIELGPGRYYLGAAIGPAQGEIDLSDNARLSSSCRGILWVFPKKDD